MITLNNNNNIRPVVGGQNGHAFDFLFNLEANAVESSSKSFVSGAAKPNHAETMSSSITVTS